MRHQLFLSIIVIHIFCFPFLSCEQKESNTRSLSSEIAQADSDSLIRVKYGADEYGMKKYVMAFLKKGPNRNLDSVESANLQRAHLNNIRRMAEAGQLVLAGPFIGDGELRGIYLFDVQSIAEADSLTRTDPAIKAGSLVMELREWYGSAVLTTVNQEHRRLFPNSP
ncbi:YciI family protein [Reichenbachiella ulvae]|uniref:YciI family protein n=1 Tax=Reichenbachiella ulvae TaxID=2980104 RepID=A0ABT3CVY0_9BACT|nr:YciI family protein [Reichenbachiella ulvae]MCV9387782.1 YciI family protein [Reichenbachiella ulvae]